MLKSRVMQCGVEERIIRRVGVVEVKCYKCGEMRHKYREYLLWKRKEEVIYAAKLQKAHQQKELACPIKGKAQKGERRLKRAEEEEAVHVTKP